MRLLRNSADIALRPTAHSDCSIPAGGPRGAKAHYEHLAVAGIAPDPAQAMALPLTEEAPR